VFINPGREPDQEMATDDNWGDRGSNRPQEYNALDDKYARVICDELLPELKKTYNISDDPQDRGIGGCSSGAIAAFTVAWQRPDQFSKVLSLVGSFTNIRGGHQYADIVRDSEKKPIRVFLQAGANDLDNAAGNWSLANLTLAKSLAYAGYDYRLEYGQGFHSVAHGRAILPDSLRWLWRDWRDSWK
jgi:enterochelin esterase family protein